VRAGLLTPACRRPLLMRWPPPLKIFLPRSGGEDSAPDRGSFVCIRVSRVRQPPALRGCFGDAAVAKRPARFALASSSAKVYARRGCFYRLADSSDVQVYRFLALAHVRSPSFSLYLSLSVWHKPAIVDSFLPRAHQRGRERDGASETRAGATGTRRRARRRRRANKPARGRKSEREPERCVGSDRSSSFEARQRTSEQPRNGTAIEETHAILAVQKGRRKRERKIRGQHAPHAIATSRWARSKLRGRGVDDRARSLARSLRAGIPRGCKFALVVSRSRVRTSRTTRSVRVR